jgi:hypothetical protein
MIKKESELDCVALYEPRLPVLRLRKLRGGSNGRDTGVLYDRVNKTPPSIARARVPPSVRRR